jgi:asparaginyl-tRNA synthetase
MKKQMYIREIADWLDKEVTIKGWLYNKRSSGSVKFLLVRDGSGLIQAIVEKKSVSPEIFDLCDSLTQESSIIIKGKVHQDKRAPGGYELILKDLQVVDIAEPYPITPKSHGTDFLMNHRHLWLRSLRQQAILRLRHKVIQASRDYYDKNGYVLIDSPIFTPAACEGTTTLFETDYFGSKAYLTQSGQLYLEPACMALGKVYCFGPTFRAEKSKTRKHLIEFWMLEPEVAFAELDDLLEIAEDSITYIVQRTIEEGRDLLKELGRDISRLEKVTKPFPRISYDEAVKIVQKEKSAFKWGDDLGAPEETVLAKHFDKPLLVHRYPKAIKAFYMEPDPERDDVVLCLDVLAPEGYGEIIGGSQRIHSYDLLLQRIKENNLPQEAFQWYLDIRKYGTVPHSGFGMGLERVVAWICGLKHLREAIPYARTLHRIYP